jgi:prolycopene isomerase
MIRKNETDVCIIGAGIGGLTAGSLLAQQGFNVKIFEKEFLIGGRALTLDMSSLTLENYQELLRKFQMHIPFSEPPLDTIFKNKMLEGYHLNLGFHVFGGGTEFNIKQATPDATIDMIKSKLYVAEKGNPYLFATNADKIKMIPHLLRLFLSGKKTIELLDNVPLAETIKKYNKGKTKLILELNPRLITTVNNLNLISTGEVFRTQRQMKLKGVRYPKRGIAHVCNYLAEVITQHGGEIHLNTPVTKIHIEKNKATGVVAKGKSYPCDVVVSTMLVQDLFTIADKKRFPDDYVDKLKSLRGTGSLCAYYSLTHVDSKILGKNFVFIERDAGVEGTDVAGMVDFMSALPESGLAPPQQHLVQSYIICTPDEAKNKETLEKLKRILDKQLETILPDFRSHLQWAIYPSIWHLDGVAKTIDNTKPDIQTPIKNLYVIGDCVKAPGIGINCAINSARLLSQTLSTAI